MLEAIRNQMQNHKTWAAIALSFLFIVPVVAMAPLPASAQIDSVRDGINKTGDDLAPNEAEAQVDSLVVTIINIFSLVVGVISVIMIIVGGLKYILSAGDASNVTSAKNTILYAVVGLVIVAFAQVIVAFVIDTAV